ncbi:hypothetical protein ALO74_200078 [Pseudomonas syringae pv. cunninghamiae]|nr:hypothetical protein ALO74_200078 [Pseudomonas syringae pv. cunninghamiae]
MVSAERSGDVGCHGCGRSMLKAKKIHKGQRYCDNCYSRLFNRRMCSGCGNYGRLPVFDPSAHCSVCERAGHCVRCGKTEFKKGMRTDYGPVCKTCVPYFRIPEACEMCGKISQRVAKSTITGLRSCQKCREPGHATCPCCRRHRILISAADGQMRCRLCSTGDQHACASCGKQIPAGRGRECEACYWTALHHKRVQINLNGFGDRMRQVFQDFASWLFDRVGPQKAAISVNKHYRFFKEVDAKWGVMPDYDELLTHFGASKLRQTELPMRWLTESEKVQIDAQHRDRDTEERRVKAILNELPDTWPRKLLSGYHELLAARVELHETDLRSVRLALRAAASFLKIAQLKEEMLPTMKQLEAFWRSSPGQVAAVTGFVGFLNRSYGLHLKSKPDKNWLMKARRAKAEHELVALLKDPEAENFESRWIAKALAYFHNVSRVSYKTLSYTSKSVSDTAGFDVAHGSATFWVPSAHGFKEGLK